MLDLIVKNNDGNENKEFHASSSAPISIPDFIDSKRRGISLIKTQKRAGV